MDVSVSSHLKKELLNDFGHPLPKAYDAVYQLFIAMERIVSIKYNRDERIAFPAVAKDAEKKIKRKFDQLQLQRILGVYPESYRLDWAKAFRGKAKELHLKPMFFEDVQPYLRYRNSPMLQIQKMDALRLTCRKFVFRHLLVKRVKEAHRFFLLSRPDLMLAPGERIHTEFPFDNLSTLPCGQIPDAPAAVEGPKTIHHYFLTPAPTKVEVKEEPVSPERRMTRTAPANTRGYLADQASCSNSTTSISTTISTATPTGVKRKQTTLEKVQEKSAAKKMRQASYDPQREKRLSLLYVLRDSMVEGIFSHFNQKSVRGMALKQLKALLEPSVGRRMSQIEFLDHIYLMRELAPTYCSIHMLGGDDEHGSDNCLKISEQRPDRIMECIEKEIYRLQRPSGQTPS